MKDIGIKNKPIVFTGCSGSGKSTTLAMLEKNGFAIMPEMARNLIKSEEAKPNGILPWNDLEKFQAMLFRKQMMVEKSLLNTTVFMDRSIIDTIAYCRAANVHVPLIPSSLNIRNRYKSVFIFDQLPEFPFSDELGMSYHYIRSKLYDTYTEYGYKLNNVPVLTVQKRVDYILEYLNQEY